MILSVNVNLNDFYSDEEGNTLSDSIKQAISNRVRADIVKEFQEKVNIEFKEILANEIEKHKKFLITSTIEALFINAKVKKAYSNEMVSLSDYITGELERTQLHSDNFKNVVDTNVKKASAVIVEELKKRYDLLFASQIVSKLNEQGMLREDIAKILLGDNKPEESKTN